MGDDLDPKWLGLTVRLGYLVSIYFQSSLVERANLHSWIAFQRCKASATLSCSFKR